MSRAPFQRLSIARVFVLLRLDGEPAHLLEASCGNWHTMAGGAAQRQPSEAGELAGACMTRRPELGSNCTDNETWPWQEKR